MSRGPRLSMPPTVRNTEVQPAADAEVNALIELGIRLGAQNIAIGHGRDDTSRSIRDGDIEPLHPAEIERIML
ncbi:hypothetical protein ACQCX5_07490 [Propionibacteriaceae bacterium G57]|uniref:hypothetical protein n=1 Tax=Aestuariimicrobium sp. G57 TaxID=3418485 RepID=UPI003DA7247A